MQNQGHTSSDTGEYIPSTTEQTDCDIADDSLGNIINIKRDFADMVSALRRHTQTGALNIPASEILAVSEAMEQMLDELLYPEYERLTAISGSIAWPTRIPSLVRPLSKRIITNPATLAALEGWDALELKEGADHA